MNKKTNLTERAHRQMGRVANYLPLVVLIAISFMAGIAISHTNPGINNFMHYFMGFFLCVFAMLKLFHPRHFANGFEMIDILAKKCRSYGYIYPYLELALGLGYLSFFMPVVIYMCTIALLGFSAIGVIKALKKGVDINCPCMGSILDVPVSTVTLTENLSMVFMALIMLAMQIA